MELALQRRALPLSYQPKVRCATITLRDYMATVAGFEPAHPFTSDLVLAGRCNTKLCHTVIYIPLP